MGLADASIRESKERLKSAIKNSGFDWPAERTTGSLAPSDIKKGQDLIWRLPWGTQCQPSDK